MHTILASVIDNHLLSVHLSIIAYIDPGTGSIVLQAVIASVVGAAIAVKLFWHRLLKFFGLRKGSPTDSITKPNDSSKTP